MTTPLVDLPPTPTARSSDERHVAAARTALQQARAGVARLAASSDLTIEVDLDEFRRVQGLVEFAALRMSWLSPAGHRPPLDDDLAVETDDEFPPPGGWFG